MFCVAFDRYADVPSGWKLCTSVAHDLHDERLPSRYSVGREGYVTDKSLQGPFKDFALHTIGWQAFQDLAASIAESEYSRTVTRIAKTSDEGRDGFFYGVPDELLVAGDKRQTTIQCKHFSKAGEKLTLGKLTTELESVRKLAKSGRAHGYLLLTNGTVTEGERQKIAAGLVQCGVEQPYVLGGDWVVAKILEYPRVRALAPRVYGLGDLGWILDSRALEQAKAIIDSMGDDLACYVPTRSHRDAVKALDEHRVVLLLGDPAVGKSSIAAALSVAATDEDHSDVIYIRNPAEFVSSWDSDISGRLFWIDDAFGSIQYAPELSDRWNKVFQTMHAAVKRKNRFILTSRTYIWRQARADLKANAFAPLLDGSVVVDVEVLTSAEKERILYNHLKFGKQSNFFLDRLRAHLDAIVTSPAFRPEMARRLGNPAFTRKLDLNRKGVLDFFRHPERFLADTLSNLERPFQAAIGLIFVHGGRLPSPVENGDAASLIINSFGVTLAAVRAALEAMKGSFVNFVAEDEERYWTYKHPTIADAYARIVGEHEELITVYLKGAKMSQILREVVCGGVNVEGASIAVGQSQYPLLLERFADYAPFPQQDVRRFLIARCGPKFFEGFLARFEGEFPWGSGLSRPARADDRARLVLKADAMGMLPTEQREQFVDELKAQIVDDADIDFLIDDPALLAFLTHEEKAHLTDLVRKDFVRNLESAIEAEMDSFESGWDPDDWFVYMRQTVDALERLFPSDKQIAIVAVRAREDIRDRVSDLKRRIEDEEQNDLDQAPHGEGFAATSSDMRSIFDDLTQR